MRTKEDIMKDYITVLSGFMMKQDVKAQLLNPKLTLEVLLDIRELLVEIKESKKQS